MWAHPRRVLSQECPALALARIRVEWSMEGVELRGSSWGGSSAGCTGSGGTLTLATTHEPHQLIKASPWALITPGRASRNGRDHGSESKDRGHANGAGMRTAKVVAWQEVAIVSDM